MSLKKYLLRFTVAYVVLLIAIAIVLGYFERESNTGANMGALMGAALLAVSKFISDHKRPPDAREKRILVMSSFLASLVVSVALFILSVMLAGGTATLESLNSIPTTILLGVIAFVCLLNLVVLWLVYGYMARKQFEALQKKGKI
ncbi:ABZJ_00895 family protein [Allohahella marinimesophila]|uniref:Uncharacterized protein n=1 Tax=Allohahella marinimesophila TaxID=1054972 RepID=A0ABP7NW17_9GAMM